RPAVGICGDLCECLALLIVVEDLADAGVRSVAGEVRRALECQQAAVVAERGIAALPESGGETCRRGVDQIAEPDLRDARVGARRRIARRLEGEAVLLTLTGAVPAFGPTCDAVPVTTVPATLSTAEPSVISEALRPSFTSQKVKVPGASVRLPPLRIRSFP